MNEAKSLIAKRYIQSGTCNSTKYFVSNDMAFPHETYFNISLSRQCTEFETFTFVALAPSSTQMRGQTPPLLSRVLVNCCIQVAITKMRLVTSVWSLVRIC